MAKNIVVIGDGAIGKTCLLQTYVDGRYTDAGYISTIFDVQESAVILDSQTVAVKLHDTAGQEEYSRIRLLAYDQADVFILCYAVNDRNSFDNITTTWAPELKKIKPNTPVILVATKTDLRDTYSDTIKLTDGEELRRKINAVRFIECSAFTFTNINEVIETAARATLQTFVVEDDSQSDSNGFCYCC